MNFNRVNYLFSEKEFDATRDLYRAVLIAACKEASYKAAFFVQPSDPLTADSVTFDLDNLLYHMPTVETVMPGRVKHQFPVLDVIEALRWLHNAGFLTVEKKLDYIQLETHLFKMIADAWATSLGVKNWRPSFPTGKPIYVTSAKRCNQVEDVRYSLEIRARARKEVVAA